MEILETELTDLQATQSASRLGDCLQSILEFQRARPTAAIILLSDGVTTAGKSVSEVAQHARRKQIPLFLVGIGDQQPPRDVRISDLLVDEIVFLGDVVNFDFRLAGSGFEQETVTVRLRIEGEEQILAEQQVELPGDGQVQSVRLTTRPQQEGDREYCVEVDPVDQESDLANNALTQVVQVRDETIRVLYVQEYPSLEFRFLKTLLERGVRFGGEGKAIKLTTVLQEADPGYADLDETACVCFP